MQQAGGKLGGQGGRPKAAASNVMLFEKDFLNAVKGGEMARVKELIALDPDLAFISDASGISVLLLVNKTSDAIDDPVDADEDRLVFADVGPQHMQVLLVVVAADDDQDFVGRAWTGMQGRGQTGAQEREWAQLQSDWDEFEASTAGVRRTRISKPFPFEAPQYHFNENNPYAHATTRHHAAHTVGLRDPRRIARRVRRGGRPAPAPAAPAEAAGTEPEQPGVAAAAHTVTLPDGATVEAPNKQAAEAAQNAINTASPGGDAAQKAYSPTGVQLPEEGKNLGAKVDPADMQPGDVLKWQDKTMVAVAPDLVADPTQPGVTHTLEDVLKDQRGFQGVFRPTAAAPPTAPAAPPPGAAPRSEVPPAPSATVPQPAPPSPFENLV